MDQTERGPVRFIKLIFYSFLKTQQRTQKSLGKTRKDAQSQELIKVNVAHVQDGDTATVAGENFKLKIRLDAIDCPEDGQSWGNDAKYALVRLIGGRTVYMEQHGTDRYGRTLAVIYVMEGTELINVNEEMVKCGHAWVMGDHYLGHLSDIRRRRLKLLGKWARTKKIGLWKKENPIPPWEWRQKKSA